MSSAPQPKPQDSVGAIRADFKAFQISDWNQGDRDFKGEGVCMGMCLDWLRRIYSPVRLAKSGFGKPGRSGIYNADEESGWNKFWDASPKFFSRFDKQIETHKTYLQAFNNNRDFVIDDHIFPDLNRRVLTEARARFGKTEKDLPSLSDGDMQRAFDSGHLEEAKKWREQRIKELLPRMVIEKMPKIIPEAHATFTTQWMLNNIKKKSNYNRIRYTGQVDSQVIVQDQTIDADWMWATYLAPNLSSMQDGRSAILCCGKVGGHGHDVAFHARGGAFYFFEPNFGEYHFDNSQDLRNLFCRIWNCVYGKRAYDWAFWANYEYRES